MRHRPLVTSLLLLYAADLRAVSTAETFRHATVASLPGKPVMLFDADDVASLPRLADPSDAQFETVDAPDQPFAKAVRVTVKRRTDPAWKVQLTTRPSLGAVKAGDVLYIGFSARCTASAAETGGGHFLATLQQVRTYDSLAQIHATPGKEWTRLHLRAVARSDYPAQNIEMVFHLGKVEQSLEFGGFVAVNLGPNVALSQLPLTRIRYKGQGPNEAWRRQALARIQSIRTGDLSLEVRDAAGRPASNAVVRIRMTRHAYQFGTFIESFVLHETPDARRYRETIVSLFNRVTCPLYWSDWGWENPENRLTYIAIAKWAKVNGFHTRGHNLIWPGWRWLPKRIEALKDDPAALRQAIDEHLRQVVTVMKPIAFDTYDVVNEPRENHDLMDILGPQEMAHWFKLTRELDPHPALCLNEFAILSGGGTEKEVDLFMKQLRDLQNAGAPVGVIGVQCHMGENLTPPERVLEILDRLSTLRLPIHATEFDIATDDEETQGDYMRDFLIAFFSHSATESLTQWGFWERHHWIPRAALYANDWRLKPNGKAYIDLVKGDWWTDETRATDSSGLCRVRGFLGDYEVTVTLPDGTLFARPAKITRAGTLLKLKP